jgi:hypothetical protein
MDGGTKLGAESSVSFSKNRNQKNIAIEKLKGTKKAAQKTEPLCILSIV